ncbi:unnamed protein product [Calypogeia fissa]
MTTSSLAVQWVGSPATELKQVQIPPARYQPLHYHRLLPVTSSSGGSFRVQNLRQHPFPGQKCRGSQLRSSLFTSPPAHSQPHFRSSKQIPGKLLAISASSASLTESEEVFFDGGVHFGDLVVNLVFGLTLVWLPLTLNAVFRNLFLRYRFTNLRVTVQSGLLGGDRKDFSYDVVKDVKVVPRFIGEWGDMAIELKDGTNVDIRSVPKFREIAKYIEERAADTKKAGRSSLSPARGGTSKKGFS